MDNDASQHMVISLLVNNNGGVNLTCEIHRNSAAVYQCESKNAELEISGDELEWGWLHKNWKALV